ncbi:MAG: HlyD family type I secretion periplasmic adaptor subunit [Candidatus Caenarcaniphilales bacterium]|nr:HlyD family type I secretion periplasmic adaptor subunit [Candidatus Caenarcaniphilales bacterium]
MTWIKPKLFQWQDKKTFVLGFTFASAILVSVVGFILWLNFANLEESITGYGQIIPTEKVRRVMAPLDGIVTKVYVAEDSAVKAGQVIMELNPEITNAEEDELKGQLSFLSDEVSALKAARGTPEIIDSKNKKNLHGLPSLSDSSYGRLQSDWLVSAKKAYEAKLSSANLQIEKAKHLHLESLANLRETENLLANEESSFERYQSIYSKGGIPKKELDDKERQVIEVRARVAGLKETVKVRKAELEQSQQSIKEISNDYQKELVEKISENQKEINHISGGLNKNEISKRRQLIVAPIDGTINEQTVKGPGEVVAAGQVLVSVVPADSDNFAEVKISNRDLAYVHLNQRAALRIDAFPYNQFGRLEGNIIGISPSTSQDKEGNPYYLVRIKPDKNLMNKGRVKYPLKSGMTLRADIITRQKNIVSIFMEPMKEEVDKAFRDPII